MALFTKLSDYKNVANVKSSVEKISESERKMIEEALIFGSLIESFDIDTIENSIEEGK